MNQDHASSPQALVATSEALDATSELMQPRSLVAEAPHSSGSIPDTQEAMSLQKDAGAAASQSLVAVSTQEVMQPGSLIADSPHSSGSIPDTQFTQLETDAAASQALVAVSTQADSDPFARVEFAGLLYAFQNTAASQEAMSLLNIFNEQHN